MQPLPFILPQQKRPPGFPPHGLCKTKKAMGGV
jgi:hypothetical protein